MWPGLNRCMQTWLWHAPVLASPSCFVYSWQPAYGMPPVFAWLKPKAGVEITFWQPVFTHNCTARHIALDTSGIAACVLGLSNRTHLHYHGGLAVAARQPRLHSFLSLSDTLPTVMMLQVLLLPRTLQGGGRVGQPDSPAGDDHHAQVGRAGLQHPPVCHGAARLLHDH